MAVSEKKLKRDAEKERENAAICLFCVKEECSGADACFREQKKKRQRQYQTDRRKAQQALDAFYNAEQERKTVGAELKRRQLFKREAVGNSWRLFSCQN